MKRIVLIDGENLVHALMALLSEADRDEAARSVVDRFDFKGLLNDLLGNAPIDEILWFGTHLQRYDFDDEIREKSEAHIKWQSHFVNHILLQGIQYIKVGYLRARESDLCAECGHSNWRLIEKGVDVGLAVHMLAEANKDTELVVVSADTDLMPAFRQARKQGAKVVHIAYEHRPVAALTRVSDGTLLITSALAMKYRTILLARLATERK